jgi:ATP-binding cassette subfamily B protein
MEERRGLGAQLREFRSTIIWTLIVEQRPWVVLLLVFSGLSLGTVAASTGSIKSAIDEAVIAHNQPLDLYVNRLIVLAFLGLLVGVGTRMTSNRIGYHLEYEVRTRLYRRLQAMNPRALDSISTGQLVTRAVTDLQMMELFVQILPQLIVGVIILLALALVVLVQSPAMAVIALTTIPINGWLVLRIRRKLLGLSWMALHRRAEVTTAIDEAVRGARVVKAFGREDHERSVVRDRALKAYSVALNRIRLMAVYDFILRVAPAFVTMGLLLLAGRIAGNGSLKVGELLILLLYSVFFTSFAQQFGDIANAWQLGNAAAKRITELLDLVPDPEPDDADPVPPPSTGLVFDDVSFNHGGHDLIHGLSFSVAPGELVVLQGRPGSGKTLTASLAGGGVTATSGVVTLDGADIGRLHILDVRRNVRVLSEEPFLFGRTVRENLEMGGADGGRAAVTDEALWAALAAAGAEKVVADLPDGLDTTLGDRGMTLSGGQRQRLALARALVAPARVLVLDDALAAVNPSLEVDIVRAVRTHAPEMAVLAITRREGLERLADRVVRLPDPPEGAEALARAAAGAAASPVATGGGMMGAAMAVAGGMIDAKLLAAIATIPEDRDEPHIDEAAATDSEHAPSVLHMLGPVRRVAILAGLLLIAFSILNLVPLGLVKIATDDFRKGRHSSADLVALSLVPLAMASGLCSYLFRRLSGRVNEGVLYVFRRRVFQRLSRLGIDYYDRELPGRVAARVVYDLDRISDFLDSQANGIYQILSSVTLFFLAAVVMVVWNLETATRVAPYIPLLLLATAGSVALSARAYERQRRALGAVVERLQEDLSGRYVIDAYGARERAEGAFETRVRDFRSARRWAAFISVTYIEVMFMIGNLAAAALISKAGRLTIAGEISIGSMVALQLYLSSLLGPIPLLSEAIQRLMAARASFRTLSTPFAATVLPVERDDVPECPPLRGNLVLDHVDFTYPGTARAVLRDVTLEIAAGTSLAIVGPTGAGKSSIAKLVSRTYDPDRGAVRAGDVDLRDVELVSYRRHLGIVPQDAFCFRGTVAENIRYGRPDATAAQLAAAVTAVGGDDVLASLPSGLSTAVEEEGRNLTAAQRQVIALARAVVTEPDIVILDEATSSLDTEHEEAVLDAVRRLERTAIFITHRLQVAQRADRVIVVDDGRIVEQGSHDELINQDGPYAALWKVGPEVDQDVVELAPLA